MMASHPGRTPAPPHPVRPEHPREEDSLSLAELFHENTKMRRRVNKTYSARIATVLGNPQRYEFMTRAHRRHPSRRQFPLPRPAGASGRPLEEVVLARRSTREFAEVPLTVEQVSRILYFSYGVTSGKPFDREGRQQPLRPVPSGGALYPLEVYPLLLGVSGLPAGVYHYDVVGHGLELLAERTDVAAFRQEIAVSDNVGHLAALVVLTAVFERTLFKYGDRGYRFVLLDAGHLAQNLCLMAAALGLGSVCLGGFYDEEINALVGANGVDESAVYMVALGAREP